MEFGGGIWCTTADEIGIIGCESSNGYAKSQATVAIDLLLARHFPLATGGFKAKISIACNSDDAESQRASVDAELA